MSKVGLGLKQEEKINSNFDGNKMSQKIWRNVKYRCGLPMDWQRDLLEVYIKTTSVPDDRKNAIIVPPYTVMGKVATVNATTLRGCFLIVLDNEQHLRNAAHVGM